MSTYSELNNKQAPMIECFFAFSNQQFAEGVKNASLEGKKIYRGDGGLYGTREGITQFFKFYDDLNKEIGEKCDPQEVYDYEFNNHECDYTGDDTEAIKMVVSYFGDEKAGTVKRKYARVKISDLQFKI